ncbi:hypothetical protein [Falsibacillus albus]|uniref:Uncharacterized protein n=1 Tax=Falsibacillus albus TaxID=2478915 RepID=A0A3L7JSF2_9BACI|nr:hypothetical protein [Falsibacillus albus]RLQ93626.1 hypothetical protein D9X91_16715 [Falsibacillus albus]
MSIKLIARVSSLLEEEDPIVHELIMETILQVSASPISPEAHSKKIDRLLERKLKSRGGNEE